MLKATVLIPTKNPGSIFREVIENVISQKTNWDFEILVIDSGSTDGTIEICNLHRESVKLKQIPSAEFGHGKTRNLGISMCDSEFVALITHDAVPYNCFWLENLVKVVEKKDNIAGAFGRHLPYPNCNPFVARDLNLLFDGFCQEDNIFQLNDQERYQKDIGYRQFLHFFSDNNACIRRSVWQEIPYPDVDFAEDQIWAKKIIEAGYSKAYADDACVFHSHNYSLWQYLQRSFDESKALNSLFGYELCPNLGHLIYHFFMTTKSDFKFAYKNGLMTSGWTFKSMPMNFFRQVGFYLGQNHDKFKLDTTFHLSLDEKLRRL